jgi:hypothetical protein
MNVLGLVLTVTIIIALDIPLLGVPMSSYFDDGHSRYLSLAVSTGPLLQTALL